MGSLAGGRGAPAWVGAHLVWAGAHARGGRPTWPWEASHSLRVPSQCAASSGASRVPLRGPTLRSLPIATVCQREPLHSEPCHCAPLHWDPPLAPVARVPVGALPHRAVPERPPSIAALPFGPAPRGDPATPSPATATPSIESLPFPLVGRVSEGVLPLRPIPSGAIGVVVRGHATITTWRSGTRCTARRPSRGPAGLPPTGPLGSVVPPTGPLGSVVLRIGNARSRTWELPS